MPYFPMFTDIGGRNILIVGGGKVASSKLMRILPFGAKIKAVAPEFCPEMLDTGAELIKRRFKRCDLCPRPVMVIAATDNKTENRRIAKLCRRKNIPVNAADDRDNCSFIFPALVQKGSFTAAISTGGASPTAAVHFKELLLQQIPDNMDELLSWLEAHRAEVKAEISDPKARAAVFRRLFSLCMEKQRPLTQEEYLACLGSDGRGKVTLVGAGCGKADLITLRGLRCLQQCEAVVYDELIDPILLDAAPESALRIGMGKRAGLHSATQEEINRKLIELAEAGLNIVRLKGGDPYLFGRGGEEMLALKAAGIACEEIPGIPSAIGIAAEAGIPVTHRGISRGLHIVTAQTAEGDAEFEKLAALDGTLVFLMGLGKVDSISSSLIAAGRAPDTPAAVISGGNSPHAALIRTELSELAHEVHKANLQPPAIIVVGPVAKLDLR